MLPAIAFCPSPPLLVPVLAAGAAAELDPLRAACREAVDRLAAVRPDEVVVVATGPVTRRFPAGSAGSLAGYGVPVTASLPGGSGPAGSAGPTGAVEPALPLGITLGAWLLTDVRIPCSACAIGPDADPAELGAGLDRADRRRALLVMGDGSARRSERAPGYVDPRAVPFDASVAAALRTGDAAALAGLDPALGADLLAAGVPAWRTAARAAGDTPYRAQLLYEDAPYGVGYFVATWLAP